MGSRRAAVPAMWWRTIFALSVAASCTPSTLGAYYEGGGGGGRLLLGFQEVKGNASYQCSPSGPCLPCQYSEKTDDKYHCSETGYRIPLKCLQIEQSPKEETKKGRRKLSHGQLLNALTSYRWRKLLDDSSKSGGTQSYITYRSCIPIEGEEKLSVLGFEVLMLGLLLISGPVIYLRQKRKVLMPGVGSVRLPTTAPRF